MSPFDPLNRVAVRQGYLLPGVVSSCRSKNMSVDEKNRQAVRKGYLLPVGLWIPWGVVSDLTTLSRTKSGSGNWWSLSGNSHVGFDSSCCRALGGFIHSRYKGRSKAKSKTRVSSISRSRSNVQS